MNWLRISAGFAALFGLVLVLAACTASTASECSSDEDCEAGRYCMEGGGVLVRDGICVDRETGVGGDVEDGGDADDVEEPDRCEDGEQSGQQTDVDCGGPNCGPCQPGEGCIGDEDCTTVCGDGTCLEPCPGEQIRCDGTCIDAGDHEQHCGACNNTCGTGRRCREGDCVCREGLTSCDGECVDTTSSAAYCGDCETSCDTDAGRVCSDGECVDDCPADQTICQGGCVDRQSNTQHCGECGNDCETSINGAEPVCESGSCTEQCSFSDHTLCPSFGTCADLATDDDHCGGCGNGCDADQACQNSSCVCVEECCGDGGCPDGVCDNNSCVECVGDGDCPGADQVCQSSTRTCVECVGDGDCGDHEYCQNNSCEPNGPFIHTAGPGSTVRKFDADGQEVWNYQGHADSVSDVAVDPDGYVYSVSSDQTTRKIGPAGDLQWKFDGHDAEVYGVAVADDGTVYTVEADHSVRWIDEQGQELWYYENLADDSGGTAQFNIALEPDDDVYVTTGGELYRFGSLDDPETYGIDANNVAADGDHVFVATSSRIDKYAGQDQIWEYEDTEASFVLGVAVDDQGRAHSGSYEPFDDGTPSIQRLSAAGDGIWEYTSSNSIWTIAVDAEGNTYGAQFGGGLVKVDDSGDEVWRIEPQENSTISGIAVDPGTYGAFPGAW